MSEQQILGKIHDAQKAVEDANDRTLRLGEKTEQLKDFVHTDVNVRLVRVEERTSNIMWAVGIGTAAVIAMAVQLFLMNGRLSGIEQNVSGIKASVDEIRLTQASSNPTSPSNIQEAKQVLEEAKKAKIKISQHVIEETGKKFMEVSQNNPEAWNAAMAFVDYRSYLNGPNPPPLSAYYPLDGRENPDHLEAFYLILKVPEGAKPPQFTTSFARTDIAISARIDRIGNLLPQPATKGAASVLGIGGVLALGEMYLRHVVLYDVEVHYDGGQLILDDVTFVNCRFVMDQNKESRALASQVLTDQSVHFTA